jgi:HSP20 family molecular chaperone IbpA
MSRMFEDILTIRAETRDQSTPESDGQRDYSVMEREYGRIVRSFRLPFSPDPNQVDAQLEKVGSSVYEITASPWPLT